MTLMTGLKPGEFIHAIGDAHIYLNHLDQTHLCLQGNPSLAQRTSAESP